MNQFKKYFALLSFALLVLSLTTIASAQRRNNNDDYGNNRNNRNDDYYGRNDRNLNATVKNLKNSAKQFERRLDKELDHSRYNGSNREDRLNEMAGDFRNAVDNLDGSYDNRRDNDNNEVRRVIQLGSQLDRALSRARVNGNIQNDWNRVRQNLRELENAYGSYDNNNNNNNNNRRNRRNRNDNDNDNGY